MEKDILGSITNYDVDMETNELQKKKIAIDNHVYDPECENGCDKKDSCCKKVTTSGMLKVDEWNVKVCVPQFCSCEGAARRFYEFHK